MEVVPVVDLKAGQVVHAVAGERDRYAPIASPLVRDASPQAVAAAFRELGLNSLYVADLDAINGAAADLDSLKQLASSGSRILWDAGLRLASCDERVELAREFGLELVVALETISTLEALRQVVQAYAGETVFSLDLKNGRPLIDSGPWSETAPSEIADQVIEAGINRLIVLDLAQVGTGAGVSTSQLISHIKKRHPHVRIIGGGGVRGLEDLRRLHACGCDEVLVATALHNGAIGPSESATVRDW